MNDEELIAMARDFRAGMLGDNAEGAGCCFMVSAPLQSLLSSVYGLDCELVETDLHDCPESEWESHYWIRLADGRVLDPTFDQFGGDRIYLGAPHPCHLGQEIAA